MLRLKINLRVRRSVRAKCLRHPRYNPEREGAGAIRAGCRYCLQQVSETGKRGVLWCRFRDQKGNVR